MFENEDETQAAQILTKTRHVLKIPTKTKKGRDRRMDQIQWSTCARLVREMHPKSQTSDSEITSSADSESDSAEDSSSDPSNDE